MTQQILLQLRDTVLLLEKSCSNGYLPLEGTLILKDCIDKLSATGVELSQEENAFVHDLKAICDSVLENPLPPT